MQPHILQLMFLDGGKRLGHAVDERLDADEASLRMSLRLGDHEFTAAEADFELDVSDPNREQGGKIAGRRPAEIDGKARQQSFDQPRVMRAQLVALAPAEKGARLVRIAVHRPWRRPEFLCLYSKNANGRHETGHRDLQRSSTSLISAAR